MARCKFCGRRIEWIEAEGRKIPIETRPPTYRFNGTAYVRADASVAHQAVCPATEEQKKSAVDHEEQWWQK